MKSKKAIVTLAIGENKFYERCVLTHKEYAKRLGVIHIVISEGKVEFASMPHLNKLLAFEYLKQYVEILYLDADVFILSDSGDIFDFYSGDTSDLIGLNEANYRFTSYQVESVCRSLKIKPNCWPKNIAGNYNYYNTGVLLLRETAKKILIDFDWKWFLLNPDSQIVFEQSYLNYVFLKSKLTIQDLNRSFNHNFFTNWYNKNETNFIHYAGINRKYHENIGLIQNKRVMASKRKKLIDEIEKYRDLANPIYISSKFWTTKIRISNRDIKIFSLQKTWPFGWFRGEILLNDHVFPFSVFKGTPKTIYINSVEHCRTNLLLFEFKILISLIEKHYEQALIILKGKLSYLKFLLWQFKGFTFYTNISKVSSFLKSKNDLLEREKLYRFYILYSIRKSKLYKDLPNGHFEILFGPFKGLKLSSIGMEIISNSFFSKVFGTYENEIIECVISFFNSNKDGIFINIGCGEGYYILAAKRLNSNFEILAVDPDLKGMDCLNQNLKLNNFQNNVKQISSIKSSDLIDLAASSKSGFILCDFEGNEESLFNNAVFQALNKFDIIIACNDFVIPNISMKLAKMANSTHNASIIEVVSDFAKPNLYKIDLMDDLRYHIIFNLMRENRPEGMKWLILKRKIEMAF